jgi:hypothetical protein
MTELIIKLQRHYLSYLRRAFIAIAITFGLYSLLLLPVFFMYPNFNNPVKKNIPLEYFTDLSENLKGDCLRISQNFARECPFPTREVHLNSEHTIVEININDKWYAYDPLYKKFFNESNAIKISYDVNRGYTPSFLKDYEYAHAFKNVKYYHSYYFIFLKYICPFYDQIMRLYYSVV